MDDYPNKGQNIIDLAARMAKAKNLPPTDNELIKQIRTMDADKIREVVR